MIYGFSIITTTGYPYYNKDFALEPRNTLLKNLFFNFSKNIVQATHENEFELIAGLVSALFNFSGAQNRPIEELIYTRPEYQIENLLDGQTKNETGTLMTVRCEYYSIKAAVKRKLDYIYEEIIKQLEPLGDKSKLAPSEEKTIQDILLNMPSKQLVRSHSKDLDSYFKTFIKDNKSYGIQAVAIASADLTLLKTAGMVDEDLQKLLRMVECPEVEPLTWKFRQSWTPDNLQVTLVFINSAFNVEHDTLKEPLYYIILCDAYSAIGELPRQLFMDINAILEK
ncbi:MAG: hypothetical protein GYA24_20355 [Candidatus Lokiarchaeota archaeon]|nr:hypothetical protein [Candidatus Lokiarchaeota archaeon]